MRSTPKNSQRERGNHDTTRALGKGKKGIGSLHRREGRESVFQGKGSLGGDTILKGGERGSPENKVTPPRVRNMQKKTNVRKGRSWKQREGIGSWGLTNAIVNLGGTGAGAKRNGRTNREGGLFI